MRPRAFVLAALLALASGAVVAADPPEKNQAAASDAGVSANGGISASASTGTSSAGPTPAAPVAAQDKETAALFAKKCSGCHGEDGSGPKNRPGAHVPNLRNSDWQTAHDAAAIEKIITDGVPGRHMPSFKSRLSPEEIAALAALVRSFAPAL